ncbi:MAG: hypothetical protein DCC49_06935, partial [Acidobacteria bacterium]
MPGLGAARIARPALAAFVALAVVAAGFGLAPPARAAIPPSPGLLVGSVAIPEPLSDGPSRRTAQLSDGRVAVAYQPGQGIALALLNTDATSVVTQPSLVSPSPTTVLALAPGGSGDLFIAYSDPSGLHVQRIAVGMFGFEPTGPPVSLDGAASAISLAYRPGHLVAAWVSGSQLRVGDSPDGSTWSAPQGIAAGTAPARIGVAHTTEGLVVAASADGTLHSWSRSGSTEWSNSAEISRQVRSAGFSVVGGASPSLAYATSNGVEVATRRNGTWTSRRVSGPAESQPSLSQVPGRRVLLTTDGYNLFRRNLADGGEWSDARVEISGTALSSPASPENSLGRLPAAWSASSSDGVREIRAAGVDASPPSTGWIYPHLGMFVSGVVPVEITATDDVGLASDPEFYAARADARDGELGVPIGRRRHRRCRERDDDRDRRADGRERDDDRDGDRRCRRSHGPPADIPPGPPERQGTQPPYAADSDGASTSPSGSDHYLVDWDTTRLKDGSAWRLAAVVADTSGNEVIVAEDPIVDNSPPAISVDTPTDGQTVAEPTPIVATIRDDESDVGPWTVTASQGEKSVVLASGSGEVFSQPIGTLDPFAFDDGDVTLSVKAENVAVPPVESMVTLAVNVSVPIKAFVEAEPEYERFEQVPIGYSVGGSVAGAWSFSVEGGGQSTVIAGSGPTDPANPPSFQYDPRLPGGSSPEGVSVVFRLTAAPSGGGEPVIVEKTSTFRWQPLDATIASPPPPSVLKSSVDVNGTVGGSHTWIWGVGVATGETINGVAANAFPGVSRGLDVAPTATFSDARGAGEAQMLGTIDSGRFADGPVELVLLAVQSPRAPPQEYVLPCVPGEFTGCIAPDLNSQDPVERELAELLAQSTVTAVTSPPLVIDNLGPRATLDVEGSYEVFRPVEIKGSVGVDPAPSGDMSDSVSWTLTATKLGSDPAVLAQGTGPRDAGTTFATWDPAVPSQGIGSAMFRLEVVDSAGNGSVAERSVEFVFRDLEILIRDPASDATISGAAPLDALIAGSNVYVRTAGLWEGALLDEFPRSAARDPSFGPELQVSPDGSRIVFSSSREGFDIGIYTMDLLRDPGTGEPITTNLRLLTPDSGNDMEPVFTADGSAIVFSSDRDGDRALYVMDTDGSDQTRLLPGSRADGEPAVSPDGGEIAFVSRTGSGSEIFAVSLGRDGTSGAYYAGSPRQVTWLGSEVAAPTYSPDSSLIVFDAGVRGSQQIWRVGRGGENPAALTSAEQFAFAAHPSISPDGMGIAFTGREQSGEGAAWTIFVADFGGREILGEPVAVGPSDLEEVDPSFSPSGEEIIFAAKRSGGDFEICIMDADGSSLTQITFGFKYPHLISEAPQVLGVGEVDGEIGFIETRAVADGDYYVVLIAYQFPYPVPGFAPANLPLQDVHRISYVAVPVHVSNGSPSNRLLVAPSYEVYGPQPIQGIVQGDNKGWALEYSTDGGTTYVPMASGTTTAGGFAEVLGTFDPQEPPLDGERAVTYRLQVDDDPTAVVTSTVFRWTAARALINAPGPGAGVLSGVIPVSGEFTGSNFVDATLYLYDSGGERRDVATTRSPSSESAEIGAIDTTQLQDGVYEAEIVVRQSNQPFGVALAPGDLASAGLLIETASQRRQIAIDNTPPVLQVDNPAEGARVSGVVQISGVVDDSPLPAGWTLTYIADADGSEVPIAMGSVGQGALSPEGPGTIPWDTSASPEGAGTVRLTLFDYFGREFSLDRRVTIDRSAPSPTLVLAPPVFSKESRVMADASQVETDLGQVRVGAVVPIVDDEIPGQPLGPPATEWVFSSTEREHPSGFGRIHIQEIPSGQSAGHHGYFAPEAPVAVQQDSTLINVVRIDAGVQTLRISYHPAGQGDYVSYAWGIDSPGDIAQGPLPPAGEFVVLAVDPIPGGLSGGSVDGMIFEIEGAELARAAFDVAGVAEHGNWRATGPAAVDLAPGEGPRVVVAQARDSAGNVSGFVDAMVVVDQTPPSSVVLTSPTSGSTLADSATFSATAADAYSGIDRIEFWAHSLYEDIYLGASCSPDASGSCSALVSLVDHVAPAEYQVFAKAIDRAGNGSDSAHATVSVNTTRCVTRDTTWRRQHNPHIIDENCTIPAGVTLTLEEGVEVRVAPSKSLTVQGTLISSGSTNRPITFDRLSSGSAWRGVAFVPGSDQSSIRHTKFAGAGLSCSQANCFPVYVEDSAPTFSDIEVGPTGTFATIRILSKSTNTPDIYPAPTFTNAHLHDGNTGYSISS